MYSTKHINRQIEASYEGATYLNLEENLKGQKDKKKISKGPRSLKAQTKY